MGKSLGVNQILAKRYSVIEYNEANKEDTLWKNSVGTLADPFTILVYGMPKNGKTSYIMRMCKWLSTKGKVYYNSIEEGDSKTIQDALILSKMDEAPVGMFMLGDNDSYDEMKAKLKKNRARFVVIDSLDYAKLTTAQYKELIKLYPRKSFIIICWEKGGSPANYFAKEIRYQVGAVIHVKNFTATCVGRYGPTDPFVIWDKKKIPVQLPLNLI